jgi:hypothetical protein
MAWWGSLTQQFQHIANQAVQDLQRHQPPEVPAGGAHAAPAKTTTKKGKSSTTGSPSRPARKSGRSAPRSNDT